MEKIGKNILNRTFRLFVSSTFSDFSVERRLLQEYVFPEIKKRLKNRVIVAHNESFDRNVLAKSMALYNLDYTD